MLNTQSAPKVSIHATQTGCETSTPTAPGMSNYVTQTRRSVQRAGGELAVTLRAKGWSIRDAADYLGVSRQRLYSVFADPGRARLWECAIAGIPACTAQIKLGLKAARAEKLKARPRPAPRVELDAAPEFEVGDVVMATKYAGIAEEGHEGVIAALRGDKAHLEILVRMPDGEDWFPRVAFHEYFATTGLNTNR